MMPSVLISRICASAPAENIVAVWTDNDWRYAMIPTRAFSGSDANFNANYGGIPKNVKLHIMPKVYQTLPLYSNLGTVGVYVYADEFDITERSATIHAESEVCNEFDRSVRMVYQVVVEDMDGNEVARFSAKPQTVPAGQPRRFRRRNGGGSPFLVVGIWLSVYGLHDIAGGREAVGYGLHAHRLPQDRGPHGMFLLNDRVLQIKGICPAHQ